MSKPSLGFVPMKDILKTGKDVDTFFRQYDVNTFSCLLQRYLAEWVEEALDKASMESKPERAVRALEEMLEANQSVGVTKEEALAIVDQVYAKPVDPDVDSEIGGAIFTLMVFAQSCDINLMESLLRSIHRGNDPKKIEKIRRANEIKAHAGGYTYTYPIPTNKED